MPRLKAFLLLLSILTLWLSSGFLHFDIPYENASKYEWRMARGEDIDTKQVAPVNEWLKSARTVS